MTRTTHNTCALAQPRFTHDRSVCPVVALYGVDADDPDAEWPPWCSPVDDSGTLSCRHIPEQDYIEWVKVVTARLNRLRDFCNRNRCRVSP